MYAKGMTTNQISNLINDIYAFEPSESLIANITDKNSSNGRRMAKSSIR